MGSNQIDGGITDLRAAGARAKRNGLLPRLAGGTGRPPPVPRRPPPRDVEPTPVQLAAEQARLDEAQLAQRHPGRKAPAAGEDLLATYMENLSQIPLFTPQQEIDNARHLETIEVISPKKAKCFLHLYS